VDLDKILYKTYEDDPDSMSFNSLALTVQKLQMFELLRWMQLLNRLVDYDEILYGGYDIKDDLDAIFLNPVASTIPRLLMFILLRWM
jgi:hypothetical protein